MGQAASNIDMSEITGELSKQVGNLHSMDGWLNAVSVEQTKTTNVGSKDERVDKVVTEVKVGAMITQKTMSVIEQKLNSKKSCTSSPSVSCRLGDFNCDKTGIVSLDTGNDSTDPMGDLEGAITNGVRDNVFIGNAINNLLLAHSLPTVPIADNIMDYTPVITQLMGLEEVSSNAALMSTLQLLIKHINSSGESINEPPECTREELEANLADSDSEDGVDITDQLDC